MLTTSTPITTKSVLQSHKRVLQNNPQATANEWLKLANAFKLHKNFSEAFSCWEQVVRKDATCAIAWNELANCYKQGLGTQPNNENAFLCYQRAVKENPKLLDAWDNLGFCFQFGEGTAVNFQEARKCYEQVFQKGRGEQKIIAKINMDKMLRAESISSHPRAKAVLTTEAIDTLEGLLARYQLYSDATKYKKIAPTKESASALWHNLGNAFSKLKKTDYAYHCYNKAIEFNDNNFYSWYSLGDCYIKGLGTAQDPIKGFESFKKAITIQNTFAAAWNNLGACYQQGLGTTVDLQEAKNCYLQASHYGNDAIKQHANKNLDRIEILSVAEAMGALDTPLLFSSPPVEVLNERITQLKRKLAQVEGEIEREEQALEFRKKKKIS